MYFLFSEVWENSRTCFWAKKNILENFVQVELGKFFSQLFKWSHWSSFLIFFYFTTVYMMNKYLYIACEFVFWLQIMAKIRSEHDYVFFSNTTRGVTTSVRPSVRSRVAYWRNYARICERLCARNCERCYDRNYSSITGKPANRVPKKRAHFWTDWAEILHADSEDLWLGRYRAIFSKNTFFNIFFEPFWSVKWRKKRLGEGAVYTKRRLEIEKNAL